MNLDHDAINCLYFLLCHPHSLGRHANSSFRLDFLWGEEHGIFDLLQLSPLACERRYRAHRMEPCISPSRHIPSFPMVISSNLYASLTRLFFFAPIILRTQYRKRITYLNGLEPVSCLNEAKSDDYCRELCYQPLIWRNIFK